MIDRPRAHPRCAPASLLARGSLLGLILFLATAAAAWAGGNIDPTNKHAWGATVGWVNFAPDQGGVTVFSDHLEGYAWAENAGWIRLGTCSGVSCRHDNSTASNYGVNNDGAGNLSGYAWSAAVGWINFDPDGPQRVIINPATGDFSGFAWGENVGWISFQGASPAYKVNTTWRPAGGPVGRIDPTRQSAWSTNAGWIRFAPDSGGVTVCSGHLEGYAWGENIGWIRLGTHTGCGTHTYANTSPADYGVNRNPATGALSGYAWSASAGWINFAPANGGVAISQTGEFSGYAWGEAIGWISFSGRASNTTPYQVALAGPTAVTLAEFGAVQQGDMVLVTWETASELDNRGFNLYRGTSPVEPDRRLNPALIPSQSQGSPAGFVYTWEDRADLALGQTYYYWLEDVDVNGAMTRHGPVSVTFQTPTAVTLSRFDASPAAGAALPWLWVVAGVAAALGVWRMRR